MSLQKIKENIQEIYEILNSEAFAKQLAKATDHDFQKESASMLIGTWHHAFEIEDNLDFIASMLPEETIQETLDCTEKVLAIIRAAQQGANANYHYLKGSYSYLEDFKKCSTPIFLLLTNPKIKENLKAQWAFTQEKEAIDEYLLKNKEVSQKLEERAEVIESFYQTFFEGTKEKEATRSVIEKSYKKIEDTRIKVKEELEQLFVTKYKIDLNQNEEGKEPREFKGLLALSAFATSEIARMSLETKKAHKEAENYKEAMKQISFQVESKDKTGKKILKDQKIPFEEYKKELVDYITKKRQHIDGVLSGSIDTLMVNTFKKETKGKSIESWIMLALSVLTLFGMVALGCWLISDLMQGSFLQDADKKPLLFSTFWLMRLALFVPLGFIFFLFNKRQNIATVLAAEYRHKLAVVEAMIGYRAEYEKRSHEEGFERFFADEYKQFFDKTFAEINKNPAEKIN